LWTESFLLCVRAYVHPFLFFSHAKGDALGCSSFFFPPFCFVFFRKSSPPQCCPFLFFFWEDLTCPQLFFFLPPFPASCLFFVPVRQGLFPSVDAVVLISFFFSPEKNFPLGPSFPFSFPSPAFTLESSVAGRRVLVCSPLFFPSGSRKAGPRKPPFFFLFPSFPMSAAKNDGGLPSQIFQLVFPFFFFLHRRFGERHLSFFFFFKSGRGRLLFFSLCMSPLVHPPLPPPPPLLIVTQDCY